MTLYFELTEVPELHVLESQTLALQNVDTFRNKFIVGGISCYGYLGSPLSSVCLDLSLILLQLVRLWAC